jgi:hypothetical protein
MVKLREGVKVVAATIVGVGIVGGLASNQYLLSNQVVKQQRELQSKVAVTPTVEPTATPSATPTVFYRYPVRASVRTASPVITRPLAK